MEILKLYELNEEWFSVSSTIRKTERKILSQNATHSISRRIILIKIHQNLYFLIFYFQHGENSYHLCRKVFVMLQAKSGPERIAPATNVYFILIFTIGKSAHSAI